MKILLLTSMSIDNEGVFTLRIIPVGVLVFFGSILWYSWLYRGWKKKDFERQLRLHPTRKPEDHLFIPRESTHNAMVWSLFPWIVSIITVLTLWISNDESVWAIIASWGILVIFLVIFISRIIFLRKKVEDKSRDLPDWHNKINDMFE